MPEEKRVIGKTAECPRHVRVNAAGGKKNGVRSKKGTARARGTWKNRGGGEQGREKRGKGMLTHVTRRSRANIHLSFSLSSPATFSSSAHPLPPARRPSSFRLRILRDVPKTKRGTTVKGRKRRVELLEGRNYFALATVS